MKRIYLKRILSSVLLLSILFESLFFALPKEAEAIPLLPGIVSSLTDPLPVPVSDAALRSKEVGFTVFGKTSIGLTWDSVMVLLVKGLLEELADSTVDWINSGFEGGPVFATELREELINRGDGLAGAIIEEVGLGAVCSPFQLELEVALNRTFRRPRDTFDQLGQCTLSGAINNVEAFFDGNFSEGGWEGWFNVTQNAENNPFGAYVGLKAEVADRAGREREAELLYLSFASGFQSPRDCIRKSSRFPDVCLEYGPVKTPGVVVEEQLQKILGSEISQLELADEFDEVLSALVGQLTKKIFNSASGLFQGSGGGGRYTGGGGGATGSISAVCSPDKTAVIVGEDVTWTASTYSRSTTTTYVWSGDEGLSGNSQSVTIAYATPFTKNAQVTINDGVNTPITVACQPGVDVSLFPPITGSCSVTPFTAQLHQNVTWTAQITGGSGNYSQFVWDGSDPVVNPGDFNWNDWPVTPPIRSGQTTTVTLQRYYDGPGTKSANVTVIDADQSVRPATIQCTSTVYVPPPSN